MTKYKENLNYYSKLSLEEQSQMAVDIVTDIERYRGLLEVMKTSNDLEFYQKSKKTFNTYIEIFAQFGRKKE
jgi:hypothetical protein